MPRASAEATQAGWQDLRRAAALAAGIDRATASVHQPWLETTFLVHRVPAWSGNLTAKVVRRPKVYLADSEMAAALPGEGPAALRSLRAGVSPMVRAVVRRP